MRLTGKTCTSVAYPSRVNILGFISIKKPLCLFTWYFIFFFFFSTANTPKEKIVYYTLRALSSDESPVSIIQKITRFFELSAVKLYPCYFFLFFHREKPRNISAATDGGVAGFAPTCSVFHKLNTARFSGNSIVDCLLRQ